MYNVSFSNTEELGKIYGLVSNQAEDELPILLYLIDKVGIDVTKARISSEPFSDTTWETLAGKEVMVDVDTWVEVLSVYRVTGTQHTIGIVFADDPLCISEYSRSLRKHSRTSHYIYDIRDKEEFISKHVKKKATPKDDWVITPTGK